MADNTTLNSGSGGDVIATDDIGGVKYPRTKIVVGADGVNGGDVSSANPLPTAVVAGEVVETLEAMRTALEVISRNLGQAYPDMSGRLRVAIAAITGSLTLATVTTVASVTNQAQMGGVAANQQIPALTAIAAESLRRNISVT